MKARELESINSELFRRLNSCEELAAVGGDSTSGPTHLPTDRPHSPDVIFDFRVDPNF